MMLCNTEITLTRSIPKLGHSSSGKLRRASSAETILLTDLQLNRLAMRTPSQQSLQTHNKYKYSISVALWDFWQSSKRYKEFYTPLCSLQDIT